MTTEKISSTSAPPQAKSAPPSDGSNNQTSHPTQFDRLRELRAEVQDLRTILTSIQKGQTTLKTYAVYVQKTKDDIESLIGAIEGGDAVRHIHNIWEQITTCPAIINPEGVFEAQEQLHYLDILDEQIEKIIFQIGALTIPQRVNEWLEKARPGYYIPFHLVFEDELPILEDRIRVLNLLAWAPETVKGGIVDVANGLIYRDAKDAKTRRNSFWYLVLGFVLTIVIVAGATLLPTPGWPLKSANLATMLIGWGSALVGVMTHIAVSMLKRRQHQGGLPPILAVSDLPLIIDARLGQILLKLSLALIGFFGLIFSSGITNVTVLNSFLVGYSLDSFVELFGASIEQQANIQVNALKKQLGVIDQ